MKSVKWLESVRNSEHREKMRKIALKNGNKPPSPKGTVWTKERKEKLRKQKKGIPRPEHARKAMEKTQFKKGQVSPNKGVPGLRAEKNPAWRGGTSMNYKKKQAPRPKPEQCEICGAFGKDFKKGLCFDHDHNTGQFRGWICTRCNVALGMVKDNTELLEALVGYLRKNKGASAVGYKGI